MIDWKAVGLKVGIEIHQQLETGKLFCGCSSDMKGEPEIMEVVRKQHPVPSELGYYDVSATYEELRNRRFHYSVVARESCLVELDEEPPHDINREALEAALLIAHYFHSWVFDEFHVMRKTITDGSNTGAFQRTIMISKGGYIDSATVDGDLRVSLEGINLEEDAANILWKKDGDVGYGLSRLGIPLVEIGTDVIEASPEAVAEVAKGIGLTLRATGRVKRGLGTIRQDINVSVRGGKRVEIKGAQDLRSMPAVIEGEAKRQLDLIELSRAGLAHAVKRNGAIIRIEGGAKYLSYPLGNSTLEQEIRDMETVFILPLSMEIEGDDVVIKLGEGIESKYSLVEERLKEILSGPSEETRAVVSGARTIYTRPLPGGARMYPETDVPPISRPSLDLGPVPPPYYVVVNELRHRFSLDQSSAEELYVSPLRLIAEKALKETHLPPAYVASVLMGTLKSLEREGVQVSLLADWQLLSILKLVDGGYPKEAVEGLLKLVCERRPSDEEQLKALADSLVGGEVDLQKIIGEVMERDAQLVKSKGMGAYGAVMGDVMRSVRGKVDGKKVSEEVKKALEKALSTSSGRS
ncbi:MAG: GatB/YqeY domain-containing protein [TACK group archaeon]|nr:GatB/YqeY domain-containing protein [TACK group archaeon]